MSRQQSKRQQPAASPRNLGLAFRIYTLLWQIALPLLHRNPRLQEGWPERILSTPPPRADIWIQAASVGEAYLVRELLKHCDPNRSQTLLLTSNTAQGLAILQECQHRCSTTHPKLMIHCRSFPFDRPRIMARALDAIQPRLVVLLESEIWPGLLRACKEREIRTLLVNGRINSRSLRNYRIWPGLWRALRPDRVLAISEIDHERFALLFGPARVETMHNIKFDHLLAEQDDNQQPNPLAELLRPERPFLVLGSIRKEEEDDIARLITVLLKRETRLVIGLFPRHLHRLQAWEKRLSGLGLPWQLRSATIRPVRSGRIILWDRIGELRDSYTLARAALVGGTIARLGGQNFLEPLRCGLRPVIGPHWTDFRWVGEEIITEGLVHQVGDWQGAAVQLLADLTSPNDRLSIQKQARSYFQARQGGSQAAWNAVESMLTKGHS